MARLRRGDRDVILAAVALSPLLVLWLIFDSGRINKDGVWHIGMAERILDGDWASAMDLLAWPLYPTVLAGIHLVTGLSLEHSGYLWNFIAYAIVTFAFLSILRELGGDRKVLLFGIAILFLQPALNNTLPGLFRDQGYWAFSLLSILFFIRFWREPSWLWAMSWWLAMAVAMLFRVEGVVFLALLPLALLLRPDTNWPRRIALLCKAHTLAFVAVLVGVVAMLATETSPLEFGRLGELETRGWALLSHLTEGISDRADSLADAVLVKHSESQAYGAIWAVMGYIVISSSMRAVNWLYLGLAGVAAALRSLPRREFAPILIWLALVNAAIISAFVINSMFLSFRYVAGLGFIVMILSAFAMAGLYERFVSKWGEPLRRNFGFPLAAVLLGIVGADGLYSTGATKVHEIEAGRWVKENVPEGAAVYFGEPRIAYYADFSYERRHRPPPLTFLQGPEWRSYDYLVLAVRRRDAEAFDKAMAGLGCDPVAHFENSRGDRSLVIIPSECIKAQ